MRSQVGVFSLVTFSQVSDLWAQEDLNFRLILIRDACMLVP